MDIAYILSQVFVVFAYLCTFITYLLRNREKIIVINLVSSCMSVVSLALLSAWTGLGNVIIAIFRNGAFMLRDKYLGKSDKITKADYLIYAGIEVAIFLVGILTFAGIPSIIAMVSMSLNTIAVTHKNPFIFKIVNIPASFTYLVYNFLITSYFGAGLEGVVLIIIIVGIVRDILYYKKKSINPFKLEEINAQRQKEAENSFPKDMEEKKTS